MLKTAMLSTFLVVYYKKIIIQNAQLKQPIVNALAIPYPYPEQKGDVIIITGSGSVVPEYPRPKD